MSAHKVGLVLDLGCCHQIIWAGRGFVVVVPRSACIASPHCLHPTRQGLPRVFEKALGKKS